MANGKLTYEIGLQVNKSGLVDLQSTLNQLKSLTAMDMIDLNKTMNISDAKIALSNLKESISEVQTALSNAYSTKLGTTDISKFNQYLTNSGTSLKEIQVNFSKAGAAGETAFRNLTTSLLTTNLQLQKSQTILDKMGQTMSNTIKWGLSSSIFNNFTSSISKSISYIKALDSDLNDIRIVSGQSAEQMAEFAKQANKAAKALGTSTTAYAEASEIFYQQGLSGEDVTDRADVVTKMANVTGDAADDVSSYMTAIWNNFYDGSESLEHYADVITALGASTASSSSEIAEGLEKFAAIGDTVGLSYEYATSALATVVANTRQSADTVGTAFKTLFARIQDLELGDTLDDGTTLGTYSQALEKVGVSIKDVNGEMKDMDTILSEMAEKWSTLSSDQQTALAQAVAGTRQYTQLVSLMDNWDDMTANLQTAAGATGTLNEQQEIYMDSVAAHEEKLGASLEAFKSSMLDEKTLKDFYDGSAKLVDSLTMVVSSLGGGENALLMLGSTALRVFKTQIGTSLTETIANLSLANENIKAIEAKMKLLNQLKLSSTGAAFDDLVKKEEEFLNYGKLITPELDEQASAILQERDQILNQKDAWDQTLKSAEAYIAKISGNKVNLKDIGKNGGIGSEEYGTQIGPALSSFADNLESDQLQPAKELNSIILQYRKTLALTNQDEQKYAEVLNDVNISIDKVGNSMDDLIKSEKLEGSDLEQLITLKEKYLSIMNNHNEGESWTAEEIQQIAQISQEYTSFTNNLINKTEEVAKIVNKEVTNGSKNFEDNLKRNQIEWDAFIKKMEKTSLATKITDAVGAVGQLASGLTSLKNIADIWDDSTLSGWDKIAQTTTSFSLGLTSLITGLKGVAPVALVATDALFGVNSATLLASGGFKALWGAIIASPALPIILAIAAAVAAVGAVAYTVYRAITKEEREIQQELQRTKQAVQDAQTAYQTLNDTISNYESARDNIDNLTEGTVEFYNAIIKANEAAQELIDTYNLVLGTDYTIDENGLITIDENAIKETIEKSQKFIKAAQIDQYQAQIKENNYQMKQIENEFYKKYRETVQKNSAVDDKEISTAYLKNYGNQTDTFNSVAQILLKKNNEINFDDLENNLSDEFNEIKTNQKENIAASKENSQKLETAFSDNFSEYSALQSENSDLQDKIDELMFSIALSSESSEFKNGLSAEAQISYDKYVKTAGKKLVKDSDLQIVDTHSTVRDVAATTISGIATGAGGGAIVGTTGGGLIGTIIGAVIGAVAGGYNGYTASKVLEQQSAYNEDEDNDNTFSVQAAQRKYAIDQGWSVDEETGTWTDPNGKTYSNKQFYKEIDKDDATKYMESGAFAYDSISKSLETVYNNAYVKAINEKGYDDSEASKIAEAALLQFSDFDFNSLANNSTISSSDKEQQDAIKKQLSLLTDEEWKDLQEAASNEIQFQLLVGDKNVSFDENSSFSNMLQGERPNSVAYDAEARKASDLTAYNKALEDQADTLGISKNALKAYEIALRKSTDAEKSATKSTAEAAAEKYKFNKAYNEGRDIFSDNTDAWKKYIAALKSGEDVSYDVADSVGEILDSLESMGIELSEDDLKDNNKLSLINTLLTGTAEEAKKAYQELQNDSWLTSLTSQFNITESAAQNFINTLNQAKDGSIIDLSGLSDELNAATMTMTEWQEWASNKGLNVTVNPKTDVDSLETDPQTTVTTHKVDAYTDGLGNEISGYEYTETVTTPGETLYGLGDLQFTKSKSSTNFTPSTKKSTSSSGSSSKKEHKETEEDRYQKVNAQLDKISSTLSKLQTQEDRLIGKAKLDNLIAQIKTLNSQIDSTREKLLVAQTVLSEKRSDLSAYGINFDSSGLITNYSQVYQAQLAAYNAAVDKYNKSSKSDSDEDAFDEAEKKYDKFTELISDYDELIGSTIPDLEDGIEEAISNIIEKQIEELDMRVQLTLDLDEAKKQWAEFKRDVLDQIEDDDYKALAEFDVKRIQSILGADGSQSIIQPLLDNLKLAKNEITSMENGYISSWFGTNGTNDFSQAYEYLEEVMGELEDEMTNLKEYYDDLLDNLSNQLEKVQEYMDEQNSLYEDLNNTYQHNLRLIQSIFGESAYAKMGEYYTAIKDTYLAQYQAQQANTQYWLEQMNSLEEGTDAWETARDNWVSALSSEQSDLENYISSMTDEYVNAINTIFETLNDNITSGKGLDYIEEEWGLITKEAEHYLDTINTTYGIQELANKYLDAIDQTDNIKAQEKLTKLMNEQVAALREQDKLTQYDLDRADLKYQIAVKQIQLQEAQQNKSTMRLRRDSQGNYTYQYASDNDEVSSIQQELSDLYNQLYNLDTDQYESNLSDIYSLWTEYQEKMAEAAQINDPEERLEKEQLLTEYYGDLIDGYVSENEQIKQGLYESTFLELEDLYGKDSENVKNWLDNQDEAMASMINGWDSTIQQMIDKIREDGGFAAVYSGALDEMDSATSEYQEQIDNVADSMETLVGGDTETTGVLDDLLDTTSKYITETETGVEAIKDYIKQIDALADSYKALYDECTNVLEASEKLDEQRKQSDIAGTNVTTASSSTSTASTTSNTATVADTTTTSAPSLEKGSYVDVKSGTKWYSNSYGGGKWGYAKAGTIKYTNLKGTYPYNIDGKGWIRKEDIVGYATGGYTGDWSGSSGKLALLHQKEMVLNAKDTENMLNAVAIMRNITDTIGNTVLNKLGALSTGNLKVNTDGDTLQQQVSIEATFPNVTSANEIEEALNNLVNAASQYVGR